MRFQRLDLPMSDNERTRTSQCGTYSSFNDHVGFRSSVFPERWKMRLEIDDMRIKTKETERK